MHPCDAEHGVVDAVAFESTVAENLPGLHACEDVFDAGLAPQLPSGDHGGSLSFRPPVQSGSQAVAKSRIRQLASQTVSDRPHLPACVIIERRRRTSRIVRELGYELREPETQVLRSRQGLVLVEPALTDPIEDRPTLRPLRAVCGKSQRSLDLQGLSQRHRSSLEHPARPHHRVPLTLKQ